MHATKLKVVACVRYPRPSARIEFVQQGGKNEEQRKKVTVINLLVTVFIGIQTSRRTNERKAEG